MLSPRNLTILAVIAVLVGVAVVFARRSGPPQPPAPATATGEMKDDTIIEIAERTVLAEARDEAYRLCAGLVTPPTNVDLVVHVRTSKNALEVTSATVKSLTEVNLPDGGSHDDARACVSAAYAGRKKELPPGKQEVPADREYELDLSITLTGRPHFGN